MFNLKGGGTSDLLWKLFPSCSFQSRLKGCSNSIVLYAANPVLVLDMIFITLKLSGRRMVVFQWAESTREIYQLKSSCRM